MRIDIKRSFTYQNERPRALILISKMELSCTFSYLRVARQRQRRTIPFSPVSSAWENGLREMRSRP